MLRWLLSPCHDIYDATYEREEGRRRTVEGVEVDKDGSVGVGRLWRLVARSWEGEVCKATAREWKKRM